MDWNWAYGSLKIVAVDTNFATPGVLTVDLDALARNFHVLRKAAAPAASGAVVKADAYGLGVEPVARRLWIEGCRHFFVANVNEGIELRNVLPQARIFVFEGAVAGWVSRLTDTRLIPVLNSAEQIRRWKAAAAAMPAAVHLDTGMSRLGLSELEVLRAGETALLADMNLEYALTHLACADEPADPLNAEQIRRFAALRAFLPRLKTSIGGSAGIFLGPEFRGDLVRPGIALYGGNPFARGENPVEPVVTLEGVVLQTRATASRQTVGYGATHTASSSARLATVGVGYADGYPRSLGNRGFASVAGTRVPVVGRVSMDLITLDVTGVAPEHVQPGKTVELLGPNVLLDDVARAAGTIGYEILTRLGSRWQRRHSTSIGVPCARKGSAYHT